MKLTSYTPSAIESYTMESWVTSVTSPRRKGGIAHLTFASTGDTFPTEEKAIAETVDKAKAKAKAIFRASLPAVALEGLKPDSVPTVETLLARAPHKVEARQMFQSTEQQFSNLRNVLTNCASLGIGREDLIRGYRLKDTEKEDTEENRLPVPTMTSLSKKAKVEKSKEEILKELRARLKKDLAKLYSETGDAAEIYSLASDTLGVEVVAKGGEAKAK